LQAALASIVYRANKRVAFGQLLAKKDTIRQIIAESRIELTKCQWPILASCDPRSHIATRISPMIASTVGRLPSTVGRLPSTIPSTVDGFLKPHSTTATTLAVSDA
jgi:hypothetical protein